LQSPLISGDMNETISIVQILAEPLLYEGCTIWMDNFYSSPDLAKLLVPED
jgi:hypothetical protein